MRAIDQAYQTVKSNLEKRIWSAGDRMPKLAELARLCRVSRTNMWLALGRLKKESLVHVEPGRAIIAGRPAASQVLPDSQGFVWQKLKERIGREALSGSFGHSPLPPQNKLALQYGAAPNTLKRSLDALVADGILSRKGVRYAVTPSTGWKKSASVIFISEGNRDWGIFSYRRVEQIIDTIERESLRFGFASRSEYFNARDLREILAMRATLRAIPDKAGVILNFWKPGNTKLLNRWFDLMHFLAGFGIPLIIIDQDGYNAFPDSLLHNPVVRILRIAGIRAGEQVAEFLLHHQENQVAFVTAFPGMPWAMDRFEGLRRTYGRYGEAESSVTLHADTDLLDVVLLSAEALALSERNLRTLLASHRSAGEIEELLMRLMQRKLERKNQNAAPTPAMQIVQPVARLMAGLEKTPDNTDAFNRMLERVLQLAEFDAQQERFRTLFPKILREFHGGVWVCSDDNTAIAVQSFLRAERVGVPREISIIGFDNWEGAYRNNLTTFDFNMRGIALEAIMMIADEKYRKSKPACIVVDGYVVERGTTRRRR
jgi:DNA-binding LacI/PurR family transcriptional regulator/DNA-binding FadR family transcriptional regulator